MASSKLQWDTHNSQLISHVIHSLLSLIFVLKDRLISNCEVDTGFFHANVKSQKLSTTQCDRVLNYPAASL